MKPLLILISSLALAGVSEAVPPKPPLEKKAATLEADLNALPESVASPYDTDYAGLYKDLYTVVENSATGAEILTTAEQNALIADFLKADADLKKLKADSKLHRLTPVEKLQLKALDNALPALEENFSILLTDI
jgi:hypothetical protein